MPAAYTIVVESHRSAATLYAVGELTTAAVLQLIARAYQLPDHVRALRIDLRGVREYDPLALRALEVGLSPWRACRRAMSRVALPDDAHTLLGRGSPTGEDRQGWGETSGICAPSGFECETTARPS
jgi:ABC-type transporter Mla MlaB component